MILVPHSTGLQWGTHSDGFGQNQGTAPGPGPAQQLSPLSILQAGSTSLPPTGEVHNIFSADFIQSVTNALDEFDPGVFRPDGDINFERDFSQWFNQDPMS